MQKKKNDPASFFLKLIGTSLSIFGKIAYFFIKSDGLSLFCIIKIGYRGMEIIYTYIKNSIYIYIYIDRYTV
ncbi:hypothetical protein EDC96DRAFT_122912 [Choanephora cucurbitarum]|nr:hypothetical protein EDC96DRAFT_122912 [Choanephora cucurbitarum]